MDDMDAYLKRLAAQARAEEAPELDVSQRVLYALRSARWSAADRPLTVFAVASAVVAVTVVLISVSMYSAAMEPFELLVQVAPALIQ